MIAKGRQRGSICSLGYQLREIDDFVDLLSKAKVGVVVDVRETPWSHKKGFSKNQMASSLEEVGINYVHAKFAGNPKTIRRAATSHESCLRSYSEFLDSKPELITQLDQLIRPKLEAGANVCLVCYERHHEDCHRSILIRHWLKGSGAKFPVDHLAPDGCDRMIKTA